MVRQPFKELFLVFAAKVENLLQATIPEAPPLSPYAVQEVQFAVRKEKPNGDGDLPGLVGKK